MNTQDRTPAKWTLVKETGSYRLYQSEGGAVKIIRVDESGNEKQVIMMPARQFGDLAGAVEFITACAPHVIEQHKRYKDNKDKEKIKLQAQVLASKALESLKALGLTQEQINEALKKSA